MRAVFPLIIVLSAATSSAFTTKQVVYGGFDTAAALQADGSVEVTESDFTKGDFAKVADQLKSGVRELVATTHHGFAALKENGDVVGWGEYGDTSGIQSQLHNVTKLVANETSLAALKADGSIVYWGFWTSGGKPNPWRDSVLSGTSEIGKFKDVVAFGDTFFATSEKGELYSFGWGRSPWSGRTIYNLKQVVQTGSINAFMLIDADGTAEGGGWIQEKCAGQEHTFKNDVVLKNISDVVASNRAFAALKPDGSVVSWGLSCDNDSFAKVAPQLQSGVVSLVASNVGGFAALKSDGSVICWSENYAYTPVEKDAVKVFANVGAFVALLKDGKVKTWGDAKYGGVLGFDQEFALRFGGVVDITKSIDTFVALKADGDAVPWGAYSGYAVGADKLKLLSQHDVTSVETIPTSWGTFIAHRKDGSFVLWGWDAYVFNPLLK